MKNIRLVAIAVRLISLILCAAVSAPAQSSTITTYVGPPLPVSGTRALTEAIDFPSAIAVDRGGAFYVASRAQNRVYRVTGDGVLILVAGSSYGFSGDGGQATIAQLASPNGLALDSSGSLYIADTGNNRVRKVSPNGVITTVAGNGTAGFSGDGGSATSAQLASPNGVAVDAMGNLYIADSDNQRVRKVSAAGIINTVAGGGTSGMSGDGVPATSVRLATPSSVAVDAAGNVYIADWMNNRIRKASFFAAVQPYSIVNSGANYWTATSMSTSIAVGSGRIQPAPGSTAPSGVAVISYRSNGVLVSEAAVPASPLIQTGRIYAESGGALRTGVAIANPNDQSASVSFYFTDKDGISFNSGTTTLGPREQLAAFLDEAPFRGSASARSFTFMSSLPVGVIALRGYVNERGEFLMTTLPVAPIFSTSNATIVLPHFAAGGGWATQILLLNPTEESISGQASPRR